MGRIRRSWEGLDVHRRAAGLVSMEFHSSYVNRSGQELETYYRDISPGEPLDSKEVYAVQAFCFCEGKLVVVYSDEKGYWGPPGGRMEAGESIEEATVREILEETNMHVRSQELLGALTVFEPDRAKIHIRSVCVWSSPRDLSCQIPMVM
jgi:8-oxo-dGTP pyrophosphatase MutT (NUDIX family)